MSTCAARCGPTAGFSLVELLLALGLAVLLTAAVFGMLDPSAGAFQTLPESADVRQRVRASADALERDLLSAGSMPSVIPGVPLATAAPGVFPFRVGRRGPAAAGSFDSGTIAVWWVDPMAAQARVGSPLASATGTVSIAPGAGCADADPTCGFRAGTTLAAVGPSGVWDFYSVTAVSGSVLSLQHNLRDGAAVYAPADSILAEATLHTYFLMDDRTTGVSQLLRYDGAGGADVPVADHVVGLAFEYYGDAEPPTLVAGLDPGQVPRVTYGPTPPLSGVVASAYPAGENCTFARTPGGALTSRLPSLGSGPVLVRLDRSTLTDGPWCPDAFSPNRYDADLLRVRQVVVSVTTEAAIAALRGPAGPLFTRSGTARGNRFVPDRTARLTIVPRALASRH